MTPTSPTSPDTLAMTIDELEQIVFALRDDIAELFRDRERLNFALGQLFIQDQVHGSGCQRIYDTRGALDQAMRAHRGGG